MSGPLFEAICIIGGGVFLSLATSSEIGIAVALFVTAVVSVIHRK